MRRHPSKECLAPCVYVGRGAPKDSISALVIESVPHQPPFTYAIPSLYERGNIEVRKSEPVAEFMGIDAERVDDLAIL